MGDGPDQGALAQGVELAREGHKEAAYAVLRRALFAEGDSAHLRLWLAAVSPTALESVQHLERANALEPLNSQVLAGLDWARRQLAAETGSTAAAPRPVLPAAPAFTSPFAAQPLASPAFTSPFAPPPPAGPVFTAPGPPAPRAAPPPPRPLPPAPAPVVIQPPDSAPPAPVLADWAQEPPAAVDPAPPAGEPPTPPAPYGRPAPADAVRPHAVGDVLAHRSVGRGVSDYSPQTLSGSPREEGVGGGYPGAPVQPPAYGVFDEAHMGPAAAPGRPAPAAARRSRLPLLLGALVVLALLGGIGVALSGGLGTLLVSTPPPTADRAATAAAAAAGAATATAGAASAATLTAIPAATAATAAGIYSDQITALVQQVRAGDNDVVNSLHQADDGMITPKDAIALFENYTHANTIYKGQTAQLTAPLLYEHHLGQVSDALAARADALAVAADYLQKLRDLNDAQKTAQDADTTYTAAATVYAQNNSTDNYATLLRAKQALDNAQGEVSRLRTYADQDHQKFDSSWQDYNSLLPMVPPPPP